MHRPTPSDNSQALLLALEFHRRQISNATKTDPSPALFLSNIDVKSLLKLYSAEFPKKVRKYYEKLSPEELAELPIANHTLFWRFTPFDLKIYELYQISNDAEQSEDIHKLKFKIGEKVKQDFKEAVLCTSLAKKKLKPHLDTLLFTCVYFYNTFWDPNGESFNGNSSMLVAHRIKFISELLYEAYKKDEVPGGVEIFIRAYPISLKDPVLTSWLLEAVEDKILSNELPMSMGLVHEAFKFIVNHKRKDSKRSEILDALKTISQTQIEEISNIRQIAIKPFCIAIHTIFSYYLELPKETFNKKRILLYRNILKLFEMDDFKIYQRHRETNSDTVTKRDGASNRLGELLRRNDENASKDR